MVIKFQLRSLLAVAIAVSFTAPSFAQSASRFATKGDLNKVKADISNLNSKVARLPAVSSAGNAGVPGAQGPTGPVGPAGPQGLPGKNASSERVYYRSPATTRGGNGESCELLDIRDICGPISDPASVNAKSSSGAKSDGLDSAGFNPGCKMQIVVQSIKADSPVPQMVKDFTLSFESKRKASEARSTVGLSVISERENKQEDFVLGDKKGENFLSVSSTSCHWVQTILGPTWSCNAYVPVKVGTLPCNDEANNPDADPYLVRIRTKTDEAVAYITVSRP